MITLAEAIESAQSERIDIVDRIVPAGKALAEAIEIAQYMDVATLALTLTKAVYARGCTTLDDALFAEVD